MRMRSPVPLENESATLRSSVVAHREQLGESVVQLPAQSVARRHRHCVIQFGTVDLTMFNPFFLSDIERHEL